MKKNRFLKGVFFGVLILVLFLVSFVFHSSYAGAGTNEDSCFSFTLTDASPIPYGSASSTSPLLLPTKLYQLQMQSLTYTLTNKTCGSVKEGFQIPFPAFKQSEWGSVYNGCGSEVDEGDTCTVVVKVYPDKILPPYLYTKDPIKVSSDGINWTSTSASAAFLFTYPVVSNIDYKSSKTFNVMPGSAANLEVVNKGGAKIGDHQYAAEDLTVTTSCNGETPCSYIQTPNHCYVTSPSPSGHDIVPVGDVCTIPVIATGDAPKPGTTFTVNVQGGDISSSKGVVPSTNKLTFTGTIASPVEFNPSPPQKLTFLYPGATRTVVIVNKSNKNATISGLPTDKPWLSGVTSVYNDACKDGLIPAQGSCYVTFTASNTSLGSNSFTVYYKLEASTQSPIPIPTPLSLGITGGPDLQVEDNTGQLLVAGSSALVSSPSGSLKIKVLSDGFPWTDEYITTDPSPLSGWSSDFSDCTKGKINPGGECTVSFVKKASSSNNKKRAITSNDDPSIGKFLIKKSGQMKSDLEWSLTAMGGIVTGIGTNNHLTYRAITVHNSADKTKTKDPIYISIDRNTIPDKNFIKLCGQKECSPYYTQQSSCGDLTQAAGHNGETGYPVYPGDTCSIWFKANTVENEVSTGTALGNKDFNIQLCTQTEGGSLYCSPSDKFKLSYSQGLVAGGRFSSITPGSGNGNVAYYSSGQWSSLKGGVTSPVDTNPVAVQALGMFNGDLYIGGSFSFSDSNNIVSWNGDKIVAVPDGGTSGGINGGEVDAITSGIVANDGPAMYVGGAFSSVGKGKQPLAGVAMWRPSSRWSGIGGGVGGVSGGWGWVSSLVISNKKLFIGGYYTNADGSSSTNVTSYGGSGWTSVGSPGKMVYALEPNSTDTSSIFSAGIDGSSAFYKQLSKGSWGAISGIPGGSGIGNALSYYSENSNNIDGSNNNDDGTLFAGFTYSPFIANSTGGQLPPLSIKNCGVYSVIHFYNRTYIGTAGCVGDGSVYYLDSNNTWKSIGTASRSPIATINTMLVVPSLKIESNG